MSEAEGLAPVGTPPAGDDAASRPLRQAVHKAIAAVTDHLAALRFNSAVAQIYMLANAIGEAGAANGAARREALETLVLLSAPMMPHLAESSWQALGHKSLVVETPWPKHDPALLGSDRVTIAVQVNGKLRATHQFSKGTSKEDVEKTVLGLEPVVRALESKSPKKVIVVPDRIVNIVV